MVGGSCRLVEREPAVSSVTRRAEKFDFYQIRGACVLIESGLAPRIIGPQPRSALVAPDIPIPRTPCPGPRVAASDHCAARLIGHLLQAAPCKSNVMAKLCAAAGQIPAVPNYRSRFSRAAFW